MVMTFAMGLGLNWDIPLIHRAPGDNKSIEREAHHYKYWFNKLMASSPSSMSM
jgi:hypothetical protein